MNAPRPARCGWILGLVFASGAVALVLELSAVRLLAPCFGATSGVWTHVIGVILLALSGGYLLGARLARGSAPLRASGSSAGEAGGRVLGLSTLGSLAGSFATTYYLIPELGLTRTYLGCALLLALLAALASLRARAAGAELAALLVLGAALCLARWQRPTPGPGTRVLEECETAYQSARVVERSAEGEPSLRFLQVNEGFDSFQSAWQREPGLLPDGYYYNAFALPAAWEAERPGPWKTLVLGLGAGSAWRVLEGTLGEGRALEGDGVEIDARVVELARKHMDLREAPGRRI